MNRKKRLMNYIDRNLAEFERRRKVFNPENIEAGDIVRLIPREGERVKPDMVVLNVGGKNGNKVFCREIGYELYANCFYLIRKAGQEPPRRIKPRGQIKAGRGEFARCDRFAD